jgi:hypothetical protein
VADPGYDASAVPKLNIAAVNQLFGPHRRIGVVAAYKSPTFLEVPVSPIE